MTEKTKVEPHFYDPLDPWTIAVGVGSMLSGLSSTIALIIALRREKQHYPWSNIITPRELLVNLNYKISMLEIYVTEVKLILSKQSDYGDRAFEPGKPGSLIIYEEAFDDYNKLMTQIYDILSGIVESINKLERLFILDRDAISDLSKGTEWNEMYYVIRDYINELFYNRELRVSNAFDLIKNIIKYINEFINMVVGYLHPLDELD